MRALVVNSFRYDISEAKHGYILNVLDSIKALMSLGLDITVLSFGNKVPEGFEELDRKLVQLNGSRYSLKSLNARCKFFKIYNKIKDAYDLLLLHHSPDFPSWSILRRFPRKKVLVMHDILSDVAVSMYGAAASILKLFFAIDEHLSAKYPDLTIVPSEEMADLVKKMGYNNVRVAYNRPGPVEPKPTPIADELKRLERPIFVYIGTVQPKIRGLEELTKLVRNVGGTLVTIGKVVKRIEGIIHLPPLSRPELIYAIQYADFGVIGRTLYYALPTKIFDYVLAGLPILTHESNKAIIRFLKNINRSYVTYNTPEDKINVNVERPKHKPKIKSRKEYIEEAVKSIL